MSDTFDAPGSRNEAILQNMLGANNPLEPPGSRIEDLLQQLLEEGSGSGLPDVTDADNGKVLGVDNGEWVPTVNTIIINGNITSQSGGTWTSDYAYDKLLNAYAAGKRIVFVIPFAGVFSITWSDLETLCTVAWTSRFGLVLVALAPDGTFEIMPFGE